MKSSLSKILLLLLLVISLTVGLCACGDDGEGEGSGEGSGDGSGEGSGDGSGEGSGEGSGGGEDSAVDVTVLKDGKTDFVILYDPDEHGATGKAFELSEKLYSATGVDFPRVEASKVDSEYTIPIGRVENPALSKLKSELSKIGTDEEYFLWGIAYVDGALAFYYNSDYAEVECFKLLSSMIKDGALIIKSDLLSVGSKNIEEYEREEEEKREEAANAEKKERLDKALAALDEFKGSSVFGAVAAQMPANSYNDPLEYPTAKSHPRYLVNQDTLDELREIFENPPADLEHLVTRTKELADNPFNGVFPEIPGKNYTYKEPYFKYMEAKAFMYLMTGEEVYGYEAILCAKNCILTMVYTDQIFKDVYRGPSHSINVITAIYDWCYDLLTEEDKQQIINGATNYLFKKLEFTYPPSNMGYISGHGMSWQFLRDYVGFSLAIYDERPDWWDYVGGRFYQEYKLGIDYCVKSGYYSQGASGYASGKLFNIYISSWIVKCATGEYPYVDGLRELPYFMFSQIMPNDRYFESGDGGCSGKGASVSGSWMIIAVGMYNDPTVYAAAKKFTNDFKNIAEDTFGERMTPMLALIYLAGCAGSEEEFAENLPLIEYTGSPAGFTVIRDEWDADAAVVLMKVGELNMANHDHQDSGTFQIYYKGLLAPGNAGEYAVYGSQHWTYFHQATVAENGLLIFDPDKYQEPILEPVYKKNADGSYQLDGEGNKIQALDDYGKPIYNVKNPAGAFYTGSQRRIGEADSFNTLISSKHNYGTIIGHEEKYNQDGTVSYAYLAGDITSAYDVSTALYVGRRMLSVYTGDEEFPMFFFVYDQAQTLDSDCTMKFLLHSVNEPEISGNTITQTNGDGKLVLVNMTGDTINKYGGEGNRYYINGINLYEDVASGGLTTGSKKTNDNGAHLWGRSEISAPIGEGNDMLNVIYVTGASNANSLTPTLVESENITGSVIGNVAALFVKSQELWSDPLSFKVQSEEETVRFHLLGLEPGTWNVYYGEGDSKELVGNVTSSVEGAMISFNGKAGAYTIEPGADIKPPNSGRVVFKNYGDTLPELKWYTYGETTELPTDVTMGKSLFRGWYLDPDFKTPIEAIDGNTTSGTVTVYGKWTSVFAIDDFAWTEVTNIDYTAKSFSMSGIGYGAGEDNLNNYKSVYENGKGYLVWTGSTGGPVVGITSQNPSVASISSTKITYTFSLAADGAKTVLNTAGRIVGTGGGKGTLQFFSTNGGKLNIPGYSTTLTDEFFTFSITVDFKNGKLISYDGEGNYLGEQNFSAPSGESVASTLEWKGRITNTVLNWRNNGVWQDTTDDDTECGSLRIGYIGVVEGGIGDEPEELPEGSYRITYEIGSATLPKDAPTVHVKGTATPLPKTLISSSIKFGGWYEDAALTKPITEIAAEREGEITVYARFENIYLNEDYAWTQNEPVNGASYSAGGITYNTDVNYKTVFEDGKGAMIWTGGTQGPVIFGGASLAGDGNVLSYTVSLARLKDTPVLTSCLRVIGKYGGKTLEVNLFTTTKDGKLNLPGVTVDLTEELKTYSVAIDFSSLTLTAYDGLGNKLGEKGFTVITAGDVDTGEEWRDNLAYALNWRNNNTSGEECSLKIGMIRIEEGLYAAPADSES